MGDTWITDMTHYLEDGRIPVDLHPEAFRLAEYLGSLVMVATTWPPDGPYAAAQPCRRRPSRRPCIGPIIVRRSEVPATIAWGCSTCGDGGVTSGWRGTPWDLTQVWRDQAIFELAVGPDDYAELRRINSSLQEVDWLIRSARWSEEDGVLLRGGEYALAELSDEVAYAANHESSGRHRDGLDRAFEAIQSAQPRKYHP
jgi:hypothetical protein